MRVIGVSVCCVCVWISRNRSAERERARAFGDPFADRLDVGRIVVARLPLPLDQTHLHNPVTLRDTDPPAHRAFLEASLRA